MRPQELQACGHQAAILVSSVLEGVRDRARDCREYQTSEPRQSPRVFVVTFRKPPVLRLHGKRKSLGCPSW